MYAELFDFMFHLIFMIIVFIIILMSHTNQYVRKCLSVVFKKIKQIDLNFVKSICFIFKKK